MSKKLLSLVLACAMVMSLFCVAFSTTAAADGTETAKETFTYYFLAPDGYDSVSCYWWEDGGCGAWPGVAMTAADEIGKNVYKVDVSAYVGTIIFNNSDNGLQTENLGITEATTGKKNVANMIFVINEGAEPGAAKGDWFSMDPNDDTYYRTAAAGYSIVGDTDTTSYPAYDANAVAGEEHPATTTLTYYFYAPSNYAAASCYWWEEGGCGAWPGPAMEKAEDIGNNVYKVDVNVGVTTIIFNNNGNGLQTENLGIAEATTGKSNVGNMIFVITEGADTGAAKGEWMSLDPAADNYYRKSAAYIESTAYNDGIDVQVPAVPAYNPVPVCGEIPVESEDEPIIEGISIYFRPDGTKFNTANTILFYVWDATSGKFATKSGWADDNTWGSKRKTAGTNEDVDGETLVKSYNIDIDSSHDVFVIVYDMTTGEQTFDCVLTSAANGKVLSITGEMLENPEDSTKEAIEAAFDGVEGNGPHKVVTSSCHVVGSVVTVNDDANKAIADKVNKFVIEESNTVDWTYENVQDVIAAFNTTPDAVWAAYEAAYGDVAASKAVILGEDESPDVPDESPDAPDESPDVPDESPDVPDESPDVPDESPDVPDESPDVPDESPDVPDESPDVPDESPDVPDESPDVPDESPDNPDPKPDDPKPDDPKPDDPKPDDPKPDDPKPDDPKPDDPKTKKAKLGDVNEDGVIDSADALLILRKSNDSLGNDTMTEALADVDGDGQITSADALAVLRFGAGVEDAGSKVGTEVEIPA